MKELMVIGIVGSMWHFSSDFSSISSFFYQFKMSLIYILIPIVLLLSDFVSAKCQTNVSITERAILNYHNKLRNLHEETPGLCYGISDDNHKFYPQEWSEYLLPRGPQKAGHSNSLTLLGENLAWDPTPADPITDYLGAIKQWYDEVYDYQFSGENKNVANKNQKIGHATQVLWRHTREVRCGRAAGKNDQGVFIVCQYWPKGNIGNLLAGEVKPFKKAYLLNSERDTPEVIRKSIVNRAILEQEQSRQREKMKAETATNDYQTLGMFALIALGLMGTVALVSAAFKNQNRSEERGLLSG